MKFWLKLCLLATLSAPAYANDPSVTSSQLLQALQGNATVVADCPTITGVIIGSDSDKTTWLVHYSTAPSGPCSTAAAAVITAFTAPTVLPSTMQLVSTGTSALNGTYAINPASLQQINGASLYHQINSAFPGGSTIPWPDVNGTPHTFNATTWAAFSKAVSDFLYTCYQTTCPSQPVTIP